MPTSTAPSPLPFVDGPDYVQTLARGLEVIRAFDRDRTAMTLSEIADRVGLARAVVRRLLLTLEHLGYVASRGRQFFLTPRVLDLGFRYLASLELPEMALPHMQALADRIGETCSMTVLDRADIVYVQRVKVKKVMTISLGVGARLPAYCASTGRVLLAGLSDDALADWFKGQTFRALTPNTLTDRGAIEREVRRARQQRFAYVEQEMEIGLCSVAVPVVDCNGDTVAALNIGMPFRDGARDRVNKVLLPALQATADEISRAFNATHAAPPRHK